MTDPNRSFQHYEVLRRDDGTPWELGRGAMGITYKAFDVNLCCEVALKVVNSALLDHPDARERFVREARAAAALRHRNVASVYHLGNDGEHFFYAMEFIDGETLDALVRRHGPLPPDVVLRMIGQVSRALAAAERQQLVHRDIKPTNLMIVHEDADEEMTIKVIDFGLARPVMGAESAAQVTVGGFVGTPQYASPEQLEERGLDARSDIYSLGVTAWYLLTGQPPFTGSLATVCQQQLGQPPPWELLPGGMPACLHDLLGHMLEKNPAKRPQNGRALREEIEECARRVPQRPWHLPPLAAGARTGVAHHPSARKTRSSPTEPRHADTLANGRYTLLKLLEEGHGTRVYQAGDRQAGGSLVTLRTLPYQLTRDAAALAALADEIRLIQAANHPNLVQVRALEPAAETTPAFLVEEPLAGFSLRDLLAGHGGTLSVENTLRLLEQVAAAADHAESRRLDQLDFALHHLRVHFPFSDPSSENFDNRTFLTLPMEQWPDWCLKVHPFFVERDALEHHTWAGDVTLVPGTAAPDTADTQAEALSTRYVRRVANLAYELLGGAPTVGAGSASPARNVSLSALNETGNAVLSRALADPTAFPACNDLLQQLTAGEHPRRQLPVESAPVPLLPFTAGKRTRVAPPVKLPATSSGTPRPALRIGTALPMASSPRGSTATAPEPQSVAGFFGPPAVLAANQADALPAGSAWERMSMNGGEPVRPGRWLLGAALIVGMFAAAFAGVLAWLLHAEPTKRPHARPANVASKPANSPRARSTGTPTPVKVAAIPRETPAPAIPEPSPAAGPLVTVRDVQAAPTPVSTSTLFDAKAANTPLASPVPEKGITLQLNSVPQGAEVRLHGRLLGVTPFETQLPPGDYEFITSYRNWPPSGKTVHLNAGQTRATSVIELLPPGLDPLNAIPPPHNVRNQNPVSPPDRRPARSTPGRVEQAIPVSPAPPTNELPVRRPLPLEPFESGTRPAESQRVDQPAPTASDDEN